MPSCPPCPTGLSPPLTSGTTCNTSRRWGPTPSWRIWPAPSSLTSPWGPRWASMSPTSRTELQPGSLASWSVNS
ncbi:unnamed protein product [Gulo gulo]|uniref:Uncharacterized protein n=1 Tax=Gulo gulo TaxID=48420 RepID=A0A9X9PWI3_GULGU|nr:unnamed protein product [Gulo gulo]